MTVSKQQLRLLFLIVTAAIAVAAAHGCGGRPRPQRMLRLDLAMAEGDTSAKWLPGLSALMAANGASASDAGQFASAYASSAASRAFAPAVAQRLGPLDDVEGMLGELAVRLPAMAPEVRWPSTIYGIITPYNQSIVTVDTVMLVGINHYLGADFDGYSHLPQAVRRVKEPEYIASDAARAILLAAYPFDESEPRTLAQRMLHYGAVTLAIHRALPDVSESTLLGLPAEAMDELKGRESEMWRAMAESGALWNSDRSAGRALTSPGARLDDGHTRLPEGAVRLLALRMVESYMRNHPQASVADMLAPSFYLAPDAVASTRFAP